MKNDLSELGDTLSEIENEERCVRLLGHSIHQAYCRDFELREALRPLIWFLGRKSQSCDSTKHFHYQDTVNSFFVDAFHTARAAELLYATAKDFTDDPYQSRALMMVQHSFGPSAVLALNGARSILVTSVVLESLGNIVAEDIERIFSTQFPRLNEARTGSQGRIAGAARRG